MKLILRQDRTSQPLELPPGRSTVGGAANDDVQIPNALGGLCTLTHDAGQCILESRYDLNISGSLSPARLPRLLLPGDVVDLGEIGLLELQPDSPKEPPSAPTAFVVKALMAPGAASTTLGAPKLICLTGKDLGRSYPLGESTLVI
jgi:hypothetical protein